MLVKSSFILAQSHVMWLQSDFLLDGTPGVPHPCWSWVKCLCFPRRLGFVDALWAPFESQQTSVDVPCPSAVRLAQRILSCADV